MAQSLALLLAVLLGGWLGAKLLRSCQVKRWNTVAEHLTTKLQTIEARIHVAALSPFERDRALKELGRGHSELATMKSVVYLEQFEEVKSLAEVVEGRAERINVLLPDSTPPADVR